jgi:hypothetical protein
VKPVGVSKFFCLLDVPGSFHSPRDEGHAATKVYERAARVVVFDNLDDDSLSDICGSPRPKRLKRCLRHFRHLYLACFLCYAFILLQWVLMFVFCRCYPRAALGGFG